MKTRSNKRMIALVLAATSLALLTGCGAASNSGAVAPGAAGVAGYGGGCVPINTTTTINFTATNMYVANPLVNTNILVLAGLIPPGDSNVAGGTQSGMMIVSPGNVPMPPVTSGYASLGTLQGQRVDGTTITMNVTSSVAPTAYTGTSYSSFPANGIVNATGSIQISPFIQAILMQTAMGGSSPYGTASPYGTTIGNTYPGTYTPYNGVTNTQVCVSNLAISLTSTLQGWLYQGMVYFYLTGGMMNGQHGFALNF